MNKRLLSFGVVVLVVLALVIGATQTASAAGVSIDGLQIGNALGGKGYGKGGGGVGAGTGGSYVGLPAPSNLSQEEADALVYMVEEEKLARDVYNFLYATWGSSTFQTIAASEQTHMDSIKNLLAVYGLTDPSSSQAGVFTNPDLQALYEQLVARGSQSLAEAFKTGGAIEEIDILDLQELLAQTDNADIQQVFNNLLKGSGNHLRAFANALKMQTGEVYQPQYLSAEAYQAIISTTSGGYGNSGGQGGNGGGGGQVGGGWRGGKP
jgi:hypothetical protein